MKDFGESHEHLAVATIKGSSEYPCISGFATFKQKGEGILVTIEVWNLPFSNQRCNENIFALHIHNGRSCTGTSRDLFADAGTHFNPQKCTHPNHAGDLPPLFGNNGYAYLSVYTDRFTLEEIIGKVIIIHDKADDFATQPSGNSGTKIACGEVQKFK